MKVNAITLRKGNVIEHNGKLMAVAAYEIMQPGKGASVIQVELRDIRSGNKDNVRFRTQETVERVRLDQSDYQYLFNDGETYTFMNTDSYEQIAINKELIGDPAIYLQDGMMVIIETYEGEPLGVQLPDSVTMEIVEAEPVVKGQTATTSYKPAVLENGAKVMVPPHIEVGTRIVVKTEDSSYVERAKD
ncbi:MAG: elongation factor P [Alphaproteobacteria bacterium]|nr:elongation factor P [Alphaproteobacteria bacterium]